MTDYMRVPDGGRRHSNVVYCTCDGENRLRAKEDIREAVRRGFQAMYNLRGLSKNETVFDYHGQSAGLRRRSHSGLKCDIRHDAVLAWKVRSKQEGPVEACRTVELERRDEIRHGTRMKAGRAACTYRLVIK